MSATAEAELRQMLRDFRAAHLGAVTPTGEGKALEAWVLMKLAHTVWQSMPAWRVTLCRGDGSSLPPGATFDLPSQRSRIQPASPTAPSYVLLEHTTYEDRRLELRGSVQWKGRSGAKHEIDVSVVPADIGEAIRDNGGGYPHGLPIVAIECKDKGGFGPLDETRQTLARMYDLVLVTQPVSTWSCRIYETATNTNWGNKSSRYISFFQKGTFGIVRAGGFQSGAGTLAAHYSIEHFSDVYAATSAINVLLASFRRTLARISEF
ncbi:hypothetical protein I3J27_16040 [Bradyrhizobium xenonodulans]|uniref:Restriction endonuclease n=1 Tax=Bradyrhizobium xenonodulans TaxID=2736875 RepID=A0ABY7MU24_9BRAD|nr:hypothetical protein [Bradyrhizobium xenonodulans]WBL81853.1 hypothetical protein I3J27_16040 [Bradyrhizobium xenonodulans]